MTGPDIYSPEVVKHQRTGATRTMSESTKSRTTAEERLCAILDSLKVSYLYQEPVDTGQFYPDGRPIVILPDVLILDKGTPIGVFEVNGGAHRTHGSRLWDERKQGYYENRGLWVEWVENKNVKRTVIVGLLDKHRRKP